MKKLEERCSPRHQAESAVPPRKRSRSSSGAAPTAPATHGQSPIDLTLEGKDASVNLKGVPSSTPASTAAHAVSSSSSSSPTPAAPSAAPASPLSSSLSSAAAASTASPLAGLESNSKSTSDAVEQLYHAVMKARMDANNTQQKFMLKKACALFNNPTGADAVLAFARRTITNAFGAVDLSIEEQRTTVVEMFIEQLVEE